MTWNLYPTQFEIQFESTWRVAFKIANKQTPFEKKK